MCWEVQVAAKAGTVSLPMEKIGTLPSKSSKLLKKIQKFEAFVKKIGTFGRERNSCFDCDCCIKLVRILAMPPLLSTIVTLSKRMSRISVSVLLPNLMACLQRTGLHPRGLPPCSRTQPQFRREPAMMVYCHVRYRGHQRQPRLLWRTHHRATPAPPTPPPLWCVLCAPRPRHRRPATPRHDPYPYPYPRRAALKKGAQARKHVMKGTPNA